MHKGAWGHGHANGHMVSGVHTQPLTLVTEISSFIVKDMIPKRPGKNLNLKIIGLHVTPMGYLGPWASSREIAGVRIKAGSACTHRGPPMTAHCKCPEDQKWQLVVQGHQVTSRSHEGRTKGLEGLLETGRAGSSSRC